MFKKNKNLTVLIASLMCISAISFSNVSAMGNCRTREQIQRDYETLNTITNKGYYFAVVRKFKLLKKLIPDYTKIIEDKIKFLREHNMRIQGGTKIILERILDRSLNIFKQCLIMNLGFILGHLNKNEYILDRTFYKRDFYNLREEVENIRPDIKEFASTIYELIKFIYGNNAQNQNKTKIIMENIAKFYKSSENEINTIKREYKNKIDYIENKYVNKKTKAFDKLKKFIYGNNAQNQNKTKKNMENISSFYTSSMNEIENIKKEYNNTVNNIKNEYIDKITKTFDEIMERLLNNITINNLKDTDAKKILQYLYHQRSDLIVNDLSQTIPSQNYENE